MINRGLLALLVCAFALPLCAEEWVDFSSPVMGRGGAGVSSARGATGAYYNPANAARRPWEKDILSMEFEMPLAVSASLHGISYRLMFDTVEAANDLHDRFQDGAFTSGGGIDDEDIRFAFRVFERLDQLSSLSGDGMYVSSGTGLGARFTTDILPRDGFSIYIGGFGVAAASPIVDLKSLRGYRLTEEAGAEWETLINEAIINSGGGSPAPTTAAGQQFSADLQAGGYSQGTADALAKWAEDSGINFNSEAGAVLLDFLLNTLNGDGTSLESGANPLEGNDSGFLIRGMAWYEVGLSYGAALPLFADSDWLAWGATLRLIQAYAFSELLRVENMDENGVEDTLANLGQKLGDAYTLRGSASRFNVGIDLGLVLTPPVGALNGLAVSLAARNINAPEFRWKPTAPGEPSLVRFDPQLRLGAAYTLFHELNLPLTFAVDADLNRTRSYILPNYHMQFIRGGVAFEPVWGSVGFGVRAGAFKNIGDANEAVTMTFGLGFRGGVFRFDVGGQVAFENRNFGTTDDFEPIPQRAGASVQIGFHFVY
jgi:hypothetical protein